MYATREIIINNNNYSLPPFIFITIIIYFYFATKQPELTIQNRHTQ